MKNLQKRTIIREPGIKKRAEGDRQVWFRASTPAIDRHGTIIKPDGIQLDRYLKNPVVLWAHDGYGGWDTPDRRNVIGKTVDYEQSDMALDMLVEFDTSPEAEDVLNKVTNGFLSAVSIGFRPRKVGSTTINEKDVPVFEEVELLELSLVPIPSNPEALKLERSIASAMHEAGWLERPVDDDFPEIQIDGVLDVDTGKLRLVTVSTGTETITETYISILPSTDEQASPSREADPDAAEMIRSAIRGWSLRELFRR